MFIRDCHVFGIAVDFVVAVVVDRHGRVVGTSIQIGSGCCWLKVYQELFHILLQFLLLELIESTIRHAVAIHNVNVVPLVVLLGLANRHNVRDAALARENFFGIAAVVGNSVMTKWQEIVVGKEDTLVCAGLANPCVIIILVGTVLLVPFAQRDKTTLFSGVVETVLCRFMEPSIIWIFFIAVVAVSREDDRDGCGSERSIMVNEMDFY